jgi:hypothetical protein
MCYNNVMLSSVALQLPVVCAPLRHALLPLLDTTVATTTQVFTTTTVQLCATIVQLY